jgi:lipopolysaccharide/colanic/teichoic acid biosynthesis glycosyltransferase
MLKRLFDLCVAAVAILFLGPLLFAIAMAIKLESSGPIFYRGVRVGLGGRLFRILKFRTMTADAERSGITSTANGDPRITGLGRVLRRYKLDELPQLFNIMRGDMSFVGPRPQVEWDVANYTPEERLLLTVRPGITDYASIRFHNEGEILQGHLDPDRAYVELIRPEKMRLALEYVRNRSLFLDMKIIATTLSTLIRTRAG